MAAVMKLFEKIRSGRKKINTKAKVMEKNQKPLLHRKRNKIKPELEAS